jgi:hypothetical protein
MLVWGIVADGARAESLDINPDLPLSDTELTRLHDVMAQRGYSEAFARTMSWHEVCMAIGSYLVK